MKRNIKKIMGLLMAILMLGALGGCSKSEEAAKPQENSKVEENNTSASGLDKIIDAGVIKVGCKIDVPSFGLQNTETSEYEGVEIDLAYEIAGEIFGCTAEEAKEKKLVAFQGVTAKTRGGLLDSGELDLVIATFTVTDERKESWAFSTPYYTDAVGLMVLKDSGINSINDLDGKVIGISQGSTSKEGFQKYVEENGISVEPIFEEFDGYPALSTALSTKNIDVFAVDRAILAGYNDESTKILEDRFAEQDYGVACSLDNKDLATKVEGVVTELLDSGKMADMLKGWGVE